MTPFDVGLIVGAVIGATAGVCFGWAAAVEGNVMSRSASRRLREARLTLQLIASLPVHQCDDARNCAGLEKAVSAAKETLGRLNGSDADRDPLCEVLR